MAVNQTTLDSLTLKAFTRERKVVVVIDLVESVLHMQKREEETISRWIDFMARVRTTHLKRYGGQFVKSYGDGALLSFANVMSSVECAFAMLSELEEEGRADAVHDKFCMRIGIHTAEVVVDQLDIFGTGVNLTARLAGLAGPDEVVVSADVRDLITDQVDAHVEDLGECYLKHFDHPIRAFRLRPRAWRSSAPPQVDHRPGIGVVPFTAVDGSLATQFVGDAVADDVIACLSRHRSLRVVSRLSTSAFRAGTQSASEVASLIGVSYVLSGSYRTDGDGLTLTAKLVDIRAGTILWADTIRTRMISVFSGQDELVPLLAAMVSHHVLRLECARAGSLPIPNLADYTLYVGGVELMHRMSRADMSRARELLDHLRYRHPRSPAPHAMLAKSYVLEIAQGTATDLEEIGRMAIDASHRALDIDSNHALALSMQAAAVAHVRGDLALARSLCERATQADPQEPHAWLTLGAVHSWQGDAELAEPYVLQAVSLSPLDPARFLFDVFLAAGRIASGKYTQGAEAARESIRRNALHVASHRLLTIALALDGRLEEARLAAKALLRLAPDFRVSEYARRFAGRSAPSADLRLAALRQAGLPN